MRKYNHEKVRELRKSGMTYVQIETILLMSPGSVASIIHKKKPKAKKPKENPTTSYDYNKVLNLLKNKRSNNEIHKELRPDIDVANFYKWKETLTAEEQAELKKYTRPAVKSKLIDTSICRNFEYKETCSNTMLPVGNAS